MCTMLGVGELHSKACALIPGGHKNREVLLANQKVFRPEKQQAGFQSDPHRAQEALLWDPPGLATLRPDEGREQRS